MNRSFIKKVVTISILLLFIQASIITAIGTLQPESVAEKNPKAYMGRAWSDDFDSYETGSALHGQGGWEAWDNNPDTTAYVSDEQARSTPNSVDIAWFDSNSADIVQQFTDVNTGEWILTTYQYVPSSMTGSSFYILMNKYEHGITHNIQDWSLQLRVSASEGIIVDYNDASATLPLVTDAWAEIRVEIDFTEDQQTVYYDGDFLLQKSWTAGVQQGGQLNLGCVDLYADQTTSTSVFYDDFLLDRPQPLSCSAGGPYTGVVDEEIQFDGTATGGRTPYTFLWKFGDDTTSNEEDPTHVYTEPGVYTVNLTVTDADQTVVYDETTATIEGVPNLRIKPMQGGLLKISAIIENQGSKEATDVQWSITLEGGAFIGKETMGQITIPMDEEKTITSDLIIGFGPTTVTVTAEVPDSSDEKTQTGFVLLFFVYLKPGGG